MKPNFKTLCVYFAGLAAGAALIAAFGRFLPDLFAWVQSDPALVSRRIRIVLLGVLLLLIVPLGFFSFQLWRLGTAARREKAFPPAGIMSVRNRPVLKGDAAGRRGRLMQIAAALLAMTAGGLILTMWQLADRLSP